jgi:hypothetical protein
MMRVLRPQVRRGSFRNLRFRPVEKRETDVAVFTRVGRADPALAETTGTMTELPEGLKDAFESGNYF